MKKTVPIATLGILLAIVLVVVGAILYFERTTPRTGMTLTNFETAANALSKMDYNTAVVLATDGISNSDTDVQRVKNKLLLAETLWDRNKGADRVQALALYKEIAFSENANSIHRALAFNDLAIIVYTTDYPYLQSNFTEPELQTFIPDAGTESQVRLETFRNLLLRSIELFPTSFAHYAIAGHYYVLRIANGDLRGSSTEELAESMLEHVKKGDALNDAAYFSAYPVTKGYYFRALAYNSAGRTLGSPSIKEREAAYKQVLDTADGYGITVEYPLHATVLSTRFLYARFLLENMPDRNKDIVQILEPFGTINPETDRIGIFTNFESNPERMRAAVPLLAEVSPAFQQFLIRAGIEY